MKGNEFRIISMSTAAAKICVEALSLPRKSRAELAHRLLISLEEEEPSPGVEAAWKTEVKKRYKDCHEGKAKVRPANKVMRDAFRSLKY
jgi:putative addiction module component (TIGR02574 family)